MKYISILLGGLLVACSPGELLEPTITPSPTAVPDLCPIELADSKINKMDEILISFDKEAELAQGMQDPMSADYSLRSYQKQVSSMTTIDCVLDVRASLLTYMLLETDYVENHSGDDSDKGRMARMAADDAYTDYINALLAAARRFHGSPANGSRSNTSGY